MFGTCPASHVLDDEVTNLCRAKVSCHHGVTGGNRCAIADTYWQTETGSHLITPLVGAMICKPGGPLPAGWCFKNMKHGGLEGREKMIVFSCSFYISFNTFYISLFYLLFLKNDWQPLGFYKSSSLTQVAQSFFKG